MALDDAVTKQLFSQIKDTLNAAGIKGSFSLQIDASLQSVPTCPDGKPASWECIQLPDQTIICQYVCR